jgi:hypothetical protein
MTQFCFVFFLDVHINLCDLKLPFILIVPNMEIYEGRVLQIIKRCWAFVQDLANHSECYRRNLKKYHLYVISYSFCFIGRRCWVIVLNFGMFLYVKCSTCTSICDRLVFRGLSEYRSCSLSSYVSAKLCCVFFSVSHRLSERVREFEGMCY